MRRRTCRLSRSYRQDDPPLAPIVVARRARSRRSLHALPIRNEWGAPGSDDRAAAQEAILSQSATLQVQRPPLAVRASQPRLRLQERRGMHCAPRPSTPKMARAASERGTVAAPHFAGVCVRVRTRMRVRWAGRHQGANGAAAARARREGALPPLQGARPLPPIPTALRRSLLSSPLRPPHPSSRLALPRVFEHPLRTLARPSSWGGVRRR